MAESDSPEVGGADEETEQERLTRNWNELLQELRVMQTGAQILTGFLLTVPFSTRFEDLDDTQRGVYLAVMLGSVVTSCLIVAPVSFHRVLFRRQEKPWLVVAAHVCARAGLAGLALVSAGVVLLVFDVVLGLVPALVAATAVLLLLGTLWFLVPVLARLD